MMVLSSATTGRPPCSARRISGAPFRYVGFISSLECTSTCDTMTASAMSQLPICGQGLVEGGPVPRITSLLIKPASAVFNLDREADPYSALPGRRMTLETLARLVDTYLFYSYPSSVFAFQGGEPTLAGLKFFEKLVEFQQQYGRSGQAVSNALQTNAILLDKDWCNLFRQYQWLLGVSLDGPEEIN